MKRFKYLIPVIIGLVIIGCVPKRFEWSPNGKWMTILSTSGLAVCDANGNLLSGRVPNVGVATWFPDSANLLVTRAHSVSTWDELQPLLSPDQIHDVTDDAAREKAAALAVDWSKGDWNSFDQNFSSHIDKTLRPAVIIYLRDHADDQWNQKIPDAQRQKLASAAIVLTDVCTCAVDASGIRAGQTVMTTVRMVAELRVSPTGKAAIVVTDLPDDNDMKRMDLWIVATDGSNRAVLMPDNSSWYPDWTPDGNSIVFATGNQSLNDAALGTLRREQVIGSDGDILDTPQNSEDLVGMIYSPLTRIRCLSDGRIFFASAQITLPATPNDLPQQLELFSIAPGKQATITRLFPQQTASSMGDAAEYFEVSPDGQWVSIPDKSGVVDVIELATGKITVVQSDEFKGGNSDYALPSVPSWRNGNELTFAVPNGPNQMNVMVRSMPSGDEKSISDSWPKEMLAINPQSPSTAP